MDHNEKVSLIADQVRQFVAAGRPVAFKKKEVSHFVPNPYEKKSPHGAIDLSALTDILSIDPLTMVCVAESGVSFANLVRKTLEYGLIPCTVPELKGITIGGAVSGCSLESMSFRYGGFHDSCLAYELVTGTGEILTVSPETGSDLFHMVHGSYGTLGILTKLTFRLLRAKAYVRMTYRHYTTFSDFWKAMHERIETQDFDFIDGIIHSRDLFVLCLGTMVDEAPWLSSYEWLRIYHRSTRERTGDFLTIQEYFFRYDTECHWLTKTVPPLEWLPVRFLAGKLFLGSTRLIGWSKKLKSILRLKRRPDVVVDVFIPAGRFAEFYQWYEHDFDFFPLWIVPYRAPEVYPWIDDCYGQGVGGTLFIDAAVYGKVNNKPDIDYSELLERKTIELNGIKTLISRNHFDKETFWRVYNRRNYEAAKARTDPKNVFAELYEKFKPDRYRG